MRPFFILLATLFAVGPLSPVTAKADPWVDPGSIDEMLCLVDHSDEDHSGEDARGFTFDGVPFTNSVLTGVDFTGAALACVPDDAGITCDGRCVDFTNAKLENAIFDDANASGADFVSAILLNASFSGANFAGVDASGARFAGADLTGTSFANANLPETNFDDSDASGARFDSAILTNSSFMSANLAGAVLAGADASSARFGGADLSGTSFASADLEGTNFDGADASVAGFASAVVSNSSWFGAQAIGADFGTADLSGSFLPGLVADGANFTSSNMTDVRGRATKDGVVSFVGADFRGANLLRVDFRSSDPTQYRADFSGADLRSTIADCRYEEVEFENEDGVIETEIVVSDCPDFTGANFAGADFRSITWTGGRYEEAIFAGAETNLSGALFKGGDFAGADFSNLVLENAVIRNGVFIVPSPVTAGDYISVDFTGTNLVGTELPGAVLTHPMPLVDTDDDSDVCDEIMGHVDLSMIAGDAMVGATLRALHAPGLDMTDIRFNDANLILADLRCADLRGADFSRASIAGIDLREAQLGDAANELNAESALGGCVVPAAPIGELPNPLCSRFDGATAQGLNLSSARLDGTTFVATDLSRADLSYVFSLCQQFPVDPDLNDGVEARQFCSEFVAADMRGASLLGASIQGPDFREVSADLTGGLGPLDFTEFASTCVVGLVPDPDGEGAVSADFCPRFEGAVLPRVIFHDAFMEAAQFGCLEPEEGSEAFPDCTDLRGADFSDAVARDSSWVAVDLAAESDSGQVSNFAGANVSDATFTCQGFSFETIDDMVDPPVVTAVTASYNCIDFTGAVLSPDFVASGASFLGVDWSAQGGWVPDLTGADLTGTSFGCFEFSYTDENDDPQTLGECSRAVGAILAGVDFTGASMQGMDFSSADLSGSLLTDVVFDAETRFAADYVPDPGDAGDPDAIKDNCTTSGVPTDLRKADLRGANLIDVIDFGGSCILVNKGSVYSVSTSGLTDAVKAQMTLSVPEPAAAAAQLAALSTLAWLSRRREAKGASKAVASG